MFGSNCIMWDQLKPILGHCFMNYSPRLAFVKQSKYLRCLHWFRQEETSKYRI